MLQNRDIDALEELLQLFKRFHLIFQVEERVGFVTRAYLSNIDTVLLHLDDPTNPMMISGVMVFKAPVDYQRLKATIEVRLLGMNRFRQRLARSRLGNGRPYWKDDPDFDLDYHVQRAVLPPPGDQAALQEAVSLLASTPLDRSKPLWQFHLFENYAERSALVGRFHHSIGDGMAMVHVLLSLTDSEPDSPWPALQPERAPRPKASRLGPRLLPARSRLEATRKMATQVVQEGADLLMGRSHLIDAGRMSGQAAAELGRFLLLEPDPDTVLKGELGVCKRAAWSLGIPLEDIKVIRRALGGTVNDVLLAIVTGALRRYLQDQGEVVDDISMRVTVPVNVRPPGSEAELGNRVGAVFVTLPVSIADPVSRLGEIVRRMNGRKDSLQAPVFYAALNVLGHAPAQMANTLITTFSTRATAVMTNVRGPEEQLYLAGSPLEALLPWAPTTGKMGVALSILSYASEVRLGVLTDEGLVPDPGMIVAAFLEEFEVLFARA
jgi:diacylglycerol O-acyltransferase